MFCSKFCLRTRGDLLKITTRFLPSLSTVSVPRTYLNVEQTKALVLHSNTPITEKMVLVPSHAFGTNEEESENFDIPTKCPGCGIKFQTSNPNSPGYVRMPTQRKRDPSDFDVEIHQNFDERLEAINIDSTEIESDLISDPKSPTEDQSKVEIFEESEEKEGTVLVCERCFSLRNYGRLKNLEAESLIPKFSLEGSLKPKIQKTKGKKIVIVCVIDLFDFDASLPLAELRSFFPSTQELPGFLEFMFVCNKFDLLSKSISKETLEIWVRTRLKENRLPFAKSVHFISSHTLIGVRDLMASLRKEVVRNTDCYIIGMQNAGKSSMLNALRKLIDDTRSDRITTASLPGTTLGFVQVPGIPFPKTCRVFDTPGLEQRVQITSRLDLEELKWVQPRRPLRPRTYRLAEGNSILIGGLCRFDIISSPGPTLYLTVWVSDKIICFAGRTEKIESKLEKHRGLILKPPLSQDSELESAGPLIPQTVYVDGTSWRMASTDVCIAGLGWVSVGCEGDAELAIWTLNGIRIATRPALLKKYASNFQKPGFSDSVDSRGIQKQ